MKFLLIFLFLLSISVKSEKLIHQINYVHFKHNSTEWYKESEKFLNYYYNVILDFPDAEFIIEGHSDRNESKKSISNERAKKVQKYFVKKGIDANRFKLVDKGNSSILMHYNETTSNKDRKINRRVSILSNSYELSVKVGNIPVYEQKDSKENNLHEIPELKFKYNTTEWYPKYNELLEFFYQTMKENPNAIFLIEGHSDSEETTKNLSLKRAKKVRKFFIKKGINSKSIEIINKGKSELVIPCDDSCTDEMRRHNRRVVIRSDRPLKIKGKYGNISPPFFDLSEIEFHKQSGGIWYPEFNSLLDLTIKEIKKIPYIKYNIEVHTDTRGSLGYNKRLSQRRAEMIKRYFVKNEIPKENLIAIGKGEDEPLIEYNLERPNIDHRLNQRVYIRPILNDSIFTVPITIIKLSTLEYQPNSVKWNTEYDLSLNGIVQIMQNNPDAYFILKGNANEFKDDSENLIFSQQRSDALKEYFVKQGIERNRIFAIGNGSRNPIFNCKKKKCTEEQKERNNRVEIISDRELFGKKKE